MSASNGNGHQHLPRDVGFERAFTFSAAAGTGCNPTALITLAEQRAPLDPIRDYLIRDLPNDGLEEGADWRNYACWQQMLLTLLRLGDDPRARTAQAAVHRCLAAIVVAFEAQRVAQHLIAELLQESSRGLDAA